MRLPDRIEKRGRERERGKEKEKEKRLGMQEREKKKGEKKKEWKERDFVMTCVMASKCMWEKTERGEESSNVQKTHRLNIVECN